MQAFQYPGSRYLCVFSLRLKSLAFRVEGLGTRFSGFAIQLPDSFCSQLPFVKLDLNRHDS